MTTNGVSAAQIWRDGRVVWTAHGQGDAPTGCWLSTISGWAGEPGPARTGQRVDRLSGGTLPVRRLTMDGRTITLTGWTDTKDPDRYALETPGQIFLDDEEAHTYWLSTMWHGVDVWATVELDGQMTWRADCTAGVVDWQIPLHAPSQYIYGWPQTWQCQSRDPDDGLVWPLFEDGTLDWGGAALSQAPLTNPGNQPAWPTVRLWGNSPSGARITDGLGHEVVYRGPIGMAGVEIDFRDGSVDGSASTALVTSRGWWAVPPGGLVSPRVEPVQAGTLLYADVTIYPTYL